MLRFSANSLPCPIEQDRAAPPHPAPAPGASHYLEAGFGSGTLAAGASTGEIQLRINKSDWSSFQEADDYSRATSTAFTDAPKIGLYLGSTLTWGTAP